MKQQDFIAVSAAIVALGVAVMLGMFIHLGPWVLDARQPLELARIFVPAITAILGWVVTIWFALRQIELSSAKNKDMHRELLISNIRLKLMDRLVDKHNLLEVELSNWERNIGSVHYNARYHGEDVDKGSIKRLHGKAADSFVFVCSSEETLRFEIRRLEGHEFTVGEYNAFIERLDALGYGEDSLWAKYQFAVSNYLQEDYNDGGRLEELTKAATAVTNELKKIKEFGLEALVSAVIMLESELDIVSANRL